MASDLTQLSSPLDVVLPCPPEEAIALSQNFTSDDMRRPDLPVCLTDSLELFTVRDRVQSRQVSC